MSLLARLNRRFLLRYRLEYAFALFALHLLRALSPPVAWGAARIAGRLAYRFGLRRRAALANLAVAFPEKSEAEREAIAVRSYEHFASVLVDILLQRRMLDRRNVLDRIRPGGWTARWLAEHGVAGLRERARGILFLTAHAGNWELGTSFFTLLGVPIAPVFRTPRNPFVARLVRDIRVDRKAEFVERRGAVQVMLERLERGGNVGFLFDQEAVHGLDVPFFGLAARTHKTPAVLSRDHGIPIFFGVVRRRGDFLRYETLGEMLPPYPVTEDRAGDLLRIMTDLARRLEERIRECPEQYFWMHRRWKRAGVHGARHAAAGRMT